MKEYTLPKTGALAQIEIMNPQDLADVLALQDITRAVLPEAQKMFLLPQAPAYFQNLLDRHTGIMIGIRTQGTLIAQMALMGQMELREAIALRAITGNDVRFLHAALTDSVVVIKSLTTHPDWRGNYMAQNMIEFALETPLARGADHTFAQMSVANKRSWDIFVRHGFGIVSAAYDPKDHQPRFIFQKPAFNFDFSPEIIADDVDPISDFPAIITLTQREALVGTYEENSTEKLIFLRNRDVLHLMPTIAKVSA